MTIRNPKICLIGMIAMPALCHGASRPQIVQRGGTRSLSHLDVRNHAAANYRCGSQSVFCKFTTLWPTVQDLAAAEDADVMAAWAGLGYYARARNLLKCARFVTLHHNGVFPRSHEQLLELPGVGPYTAAAVSSIAFDLPETVVDGNVERVIARLFDIHTPTNGQGKLTEYAKTLTPQKRPGDYAQAIWFGGHDLHASKTSLRIVSMADKLHRLGQWYAFDCPKSCPRKRNQRAWYRLRRASRRWCIPIETRPESGLLGVCRHGPRQIGRETAVNEDAPIHAEWKTHAGEVRHTFTHFHLKLRVKTALVPLDRRQTRGEFVQAADFAPAALPP